MSPSSEVLPRALDGKDLEKIVKFLTDIKNGKVQGSNKVALGMVDLLEEIITESQNHSPLALCSLVRECGRLAQSEPSAANMARRILRAIRDESRTAANQQNAETGDSLQRLVLGAGTRRGTLGAGHDVRPALRDHVAELRTELESSWSSICSQSRELLHSGELILTYGVDALTENFLRSAASRGYRLVIVDSGKQSRVMANRLSTAGVPVTFVSAAAVFALMSRVNKVVVGARAVLAGGTLLAAAGAHNATTAAAHYRVPVLALSPLYKLTPLYAFDQHHFNSSLSPHDCVSYQNCESVSSHAYAPKFDLIPPDHVSLVVTNLGSHSPSYIYRLLSELYDPKDYQFE